MSALTLTAPAAGTVSYPVEPGQSLEFSFDVSAASFERDGDDLAVTLENGAAVSLENFFAAGETGTLPELKLEDGTVLDTAEFLLSMNPDMDIATAAGPASTAPGSGGSGDYLADAGALMGGVDTLGKLPGTGAVNAGGRGAAEALSGTGAATAAPGDTGAGGTGAASPEPEADPYHTRLIITSDSASGYTFMVLDQNGAPVQNLSQVSFDFGDPAYIELGGIAPDGTVTVLLTQAGKEALGGLSANDAPLRELVTISIGGKEYAMPLILSGDKNYDSSSEESRHGPEGSTLAAEWYSSGEGLTQGETVILGGEQYNSVDIVNRGPATYEEILMSGLSEYSTGAANVTIRAGASETGEGRISIAAYGSHSTGVLAGAQPNTYQAPMPQSASTVIDAGPNGLVSISAEGTDSSVGIAAVSSGGEHDASLRISGGEVHVSASLAESPFPFSFRRAEAVHTTAGDGKAAVTDIRATGAVTISALDSGMQGIMLGTATQASGGSTASTLIAGDSVDIITTTAGLQAIGMWALTYQGTASNEITASGAVNITADALDDTYGFSNNALGLSAQQAYGGSASNTVTGETVTVAATARSIYSSSAVAASVGHGDSLVGNTITGETVNLKASATAVEQADASGLQVLAAAGFENASGFSSNTVTAGTLDVTATAGASGEQGAALASGLGAQAGLQWYPNYIGRGGNSLEAETVTISAAAHASGDQGTATSYGITSRIFNSGHAANSITAAGTVTVSAAAETTGDDGVSHAYGLNAGREGLAGTSSNTLRADTVDIEATAVAGGDRGASFAFGMSASGQNSSGFSSNTIEAGSVTLAASAQEATAMYASSTGNSQGGLSTNTITADDVTVSADGSTLSYAMYASGNAANTIQASEGSTGFTVVLEAKGNVGEAVAMFAEGAGAVNEIKGGAGDDSVTLIGDVSAKDGGENIIDLGGGLNTLSLSGQIQAGALNVYAEGGTTYLILNAANAGQFEQYYQGWLQNLADNNLLDGMQVAKISVNIDANGDAGDLSWLGGLFGGDVAYEVNGVETDLSGGDAAFAAPFSASFGEEADMSGGGDTLYLNFDSGDQDPGSVLLGNDLSGVGTLVLDMHNGSQDALALNSLLDAVSSGGGVEEVFIKGDAADSIEGLTDGWAKGNAVEVEGIAYYEFTNTSLDLIIYAETTMIDK